jgi:hypothetical protein
MFIHEKLSVRLFRGPEIFQKCRRHIFLTCVQDGCEWSASNRRSSWYPLDRWIEGPRTSSNVLAEKKNTF